MSPARRQPGPSRRAAALLGLLLVIAASGSAQTGWVRLSCPDPAFSVEAPAGWRLEAVPGHGARLIPPGDGPVVEVVTWPALHLPATAQKAAAEHEGVLGRAVQYHRRSSEEIATAIGPALLVTGEADAFGVEETSIFCAWGSDNVHWVLGTFAPADEVETVRTELLDRMTRSFRPGAGLPGSEPAAPVEPPLAYPPPQPPAMTPGPQPTEMAPEPPAPAEPTTNPQPSASTEPPLTVHSPPATPPRPTGPGEPEVSEAPTPAGGSQIPGGPAVAPEIDEPHASWRRHLDQSGFSLDLPAGWTARAESGVIVAAPATTVTSVLAGPTGAPSLRDTAAGSSARRAVIIWPASGPDPGAAAALGAALAEITRFELAGPPVSAGEAAGAALLIASTTAGERVSASWSWADGDGLLVALVAPAAHPDLRGGAMARIAASFRPAPWPVPGAARYQRVAGDAGELTWELPVGWQARGGVLDANGDLAIDLEATSADGTMRVAWQQPLRPSFRALTPLLVSLGWHEGERYSAPETGQALLIYQRRTPQELVVSILLARQAGELQGVSVDARTPSSAVAGLLAGEEGMGQAVLVRGESANGRRERLYLVATARAPAPLSTTCWDGAALVADAPEGALAQAAAVLARMVESAEVTGVGKAALQELIERARRALVDVPENLRPAGGIDGLAGVIDQQAPAGARTWTLPAGALQHWSDEAASGRLRQEDVEGGPDDA